MAKITLAALFQKLRDETVINRCEQYAHWTLPYLMADPREVTASGRVVVERDFQEIGALLVNNLGAKLTRLLFPSQFSFFKASASPRFKRYASQQGIDAAQLAKLFANLETSAKDRLVTNAGYASLILLMKYLIVTGYCLVYRDTSEGRLIVWGPQCLAMRRDGTGKLLDCVLREYTTVEALPEDLRSALRVQNRVKYGRDEQQVEKYTRIHFSYNNGNAGYYVTQEVDTIAVGTPSWFPANLCPWMVPTWTLIPGEHYGRGLVEDFAGGFAKMSTLSESAALYGVELTRVLHLVGPSAGSDIDDFANADNGQFIRGDPDAVQAHEAGDATKLKAVMDVAELTFTRLAKAFMYSGVARQAERVTAFELRQEAVEAEHALGGAISTLAAGVQVPLAHVLMSEVSDEATIGLVTGELQPDVTAGIPAIGRSGDVDNLLQASQEIAGVYPIAQLDKRINPAKLIDIILAGRSIDPSTVFFTEEEQRANEDANKANQEAQANLIQGQTLADQGNQIAQTLGA